MRFGIRDRGSVFCLFFFLVAIYVEQRSGTDYIHSGAGSQVARAGAGLEFIVEGEASRILALICPRCSSPSCLAGRILRSADRSLC